MRIFGFNIDRKHPDARVHEVVPAQPGFDRFGLTQRGLRPGMWVMRNGEWPRAGILTELTADGMARVMTTQEDGTNQLSVLLPVQSIRQAFLDEIPTPRRHKRTDLLVAMGYARR